VRKGTRQDRLIAGQWEKKCRGMVKNNATQRGRGGTNPIGNRTMAKRGITGEEKKKKKNRTASLDPPRKNESRET